LKFKLNKKYKNHIKIPTRDFKRRFQKNEKKKEELNPNVFQSAKI